jgi:hypothetical protein
MIDLSGQQVGRWLVIERMPKQRFAWWCRCACGRMRAVKLGKLWGRKRSLGCEACTERGDA